jgi:hypothetical protein
MNDELEERTLTTADLAAAAEPAARANEESNRPAADRRPVSTTKADEQLAPLFVPDVAKDFRSRWDAVQSGFVDDPKEAVRHGDELVAQVMKSLAETFASERAKLESQFEQTDQASTENLRLAFRRYRSFFERLLSL